MTDQLQPGDHAPAFDLASDGENNLSSSDLKGKTVVLYFYPKDDTPGCTLEAQDFNARQADFAAVGTTVIGLSKDSVKSHDKFCKKHGLSIVLASDEGGQTCENYGVWVEKSMYGKKYMGTARKTFIIDENQNIIAIIDKVDTKNASQQVLDTLK